MPLGWGEACTFLCLGVKVNISVVYDQATDIYVNMVFIIYSLFLVG